ncbi:MAG: formate dehydrogenase [Betaproteobacteria bacterium]
MKSESKISTPVSPPAARRNFLLGATLASAGAVAAVIAGGSANDIVEIADSETKPAKSKGYHLTPHIAQYYETTKI